MEQVICLATPFSGTFTCNDLLKPGDCRESDYSDLETDAWAAS